MINDKEGGFSVALLLNKFKQLQQDIMIIIKQKRLYAFFNSKVINSMMLIMEFFILLIPCFNDVMVPIICGAASLLLIIGYTVWLFVKKPAKITVNKWLSEISSLYTIYFLIVIAMDKFSIWWDIFAVLIFISIFFISLIKPKDRVFLLDSQSLESKKTV